jgi:hypothetical protein
MQSFKIENYEGEHGKGTFPHFHHLSLSECESVRELLKERLQMTGDVSYLDITVAVDGLDFICNVGNAQEEYFNIDAILRHLITDENEKIFINWYRFDDIDELMAGDLISLFNDIWYPSADDIEIFDKNVNWIVSVDHSGFIKTIIFDKN